MNYPEMDMRKSMEQDYILLIKLGRRFYRYIHEGPWWRRLLFAPLRRFVYRERLCYLGQAVPRDPVTHI